MTEPRNPQVFRPIFTPSIKHSEARIGHIKDSASGWNRKGPQNPTMKLFQKRHLKCWDLGQGPRDDDFFDDRLETSCDWGGESTYSNNQPLPHESPKPVDLHDARLWCKFSPAPRNTSLHKTWLAKRNHHCRHCPTITKLGHPSSVSRILPNPFDLFDPWPQSIKTQDICHRTFMPSLPSSCAPWLKRLHPRRTSHWHCKCPNKNTKANSTPCRLPETPWTAWRSCDHH